MLYASPFKPMPVAKFEKLLADPDKIIEGVHLADFRPDQKKATDLEIKEFAAFDESLEGFMGTLMDVTSVVRVVDAKNRTEYRLDNNGHFEKYRGHCYDIWGRKIECSNCISMIAVESRQIASKYETIGSSTYYVIAKPIMIAGELYSLETAIRIIQ